MNVQKKIYSFLLIIACIYSVFLIFFISDTNRLDTSYCDNCYYGDYKIEYNQYRKVSENLNFINWFILVCNLILIIKLITSRKTFANAREFYLILLIFIIFGIVLLHYQFSFFERNFKLDFL